MKVIASGIPMIDEKAAETVALIAREGIDLSAQPRPFPSSPFWNGLRALGTELWLDTGDIIAAERLWTQEFSGLTLNNTLLNSEVQKGIYDGLIHSANQALGLLDPQTRTLEIAFILNAHHGLRLVQMFAPRHVSVELHTLLADDVEATLAYARRYHALCPDRFLVKIPLTPSGLIAARQLKSEGIAINLTLGFGARQNYLSAAFAGPDFVNVFLGRINAYIENNKLGSGMAGEKVTAASQKAVKEADRMARKQTRQIAASIRSGAQIGLLAGIDVHTIPIAAAQEAPRVVKEPWTSWLSQIHAVTYGPDFDPRKIRLDRLWEVDETMRDFVDVVLRDPPDDGEAFVNRARERGIHDLFPALTPDERLRILGEGKIPRHGNWAHRIEEGTLALDSLLTAAGLGSFSADQKQLDNRIRRLIAD